MRRTILLYAFISLLLDLMIAVAATYLVDAFKGREWTVWVAVTVLFLASLPLTVKLAGITDGARTSNMRGQDGHEKPTLANGSPRATNYPPSISHDATTSSPSSSSKPIFQGDNMSANYFQTNNIKSNYLSEVRQFITASLGEQELKELVTDNYPEVRADLGNKYSFREQVDAILSYCERHGALGELVDRVRKINPYQYEQFKSRLGS